MEAQAGLALCRYGRSEIHRTPLGEPTAILVAPFEETLPFLLYLRNA